MSAPHEVELKYSLEGVGDFEKLLVLPSPESEAAEEQSNHYFDTADHLLLGRRILLRARRGNELRLTLKVGVEVQPGCFDSLELENDLEPAQFERLLREPESVYTLRCAARDELEKRVGRVPLYYLGELRNERFRRRLGAFVLELDRCTFPDGTVSYELEVELAGVSAVASADEWIRRELADRGVRFRPERRTKLERFVRWRHSATGAEPPEK